MSQFLNILYVAVGVILLFGAAVFVHEFGHYWVARRRGMKVEAFAIGFGPKIFAWTRDGIEYSVRWIPAGGFVKLPQMITSQALEGKNDAGETLPPASPLTRILVAFAGPFMNVVFAFAIASVIYVAGLPTPVNPSIIGYVETDSPEAQAGIQPGDRIVEVNGKPVRTWQQIGFITGLAPTNVFQVTVEREGVRRTHPLTALVSEFSGLKALNLYPLDPPEVKDVVAGGAGARAGLRTNDMVLAFGGMPIVNHMQLIDLIRQRPEKTTEILVQRGSEKVTLSITPVLNPATQKGQIGVMLGGSSANIYELQRPGPTPWAQVSDVWEKTIATLGALVNSKKTGVGASDLSGPVGIFTMLASQVNADYRLALSFLVLLNINLAILNLLPLPVLDGGHIVMAILEKIRGRALSPLVLEYATSIFALLLIGFMLYVSFHDVKRFRQGIFQSLFQGETRIEEPAVPTTR